MSVYTVAARRWARGWELHISDEDGREVGVTQSRTLAGGEAMVRDYLEVDDRPAPDHIELRPELDGDLATRAAAARAGVRAAEQAQAAAAARSRQVAHELKAAGLSGADIAAVLGVSAQRVSQLINAAPARRRPPAASTAAEATA